MRRPYTGLRVVELGDRIGSAYCGKLLADLGADVAIIEPPGGNRLRGYGPFRDNLPNPSKSGLFGYLNSGKRSVVVRSRARTALAALVGAADVLVTGFATAALAEWGARHTDLVEPHPSLVVAHITPFGLDGPYVDDKGDELVTTALSGMTRRIGGAGRAPLTLPLAQAGYQAGMAAASGITCALLARRITGRGQCVEVSEAEVLATVHIGYAVTRFQLAGNEENRAGHRLASVPYPQTVLPCKDGYVALNTPEGRQWRRFLEMIDNPAWGTDPKYANRSRNSVDFADELDGFLTPWLKRHTRAEIFSLSRKFDVPCGPVRTIDEIVQDRHLEQRGFFTTISFPDGDAARVPGSPIRLSRTAISGGGAVPAIGQHSAMTASEWSMPAQPAEWNQPGGPGLATATDVAACGPLHGYRVVDMGWVFAGAIPGQVLADMGAEVIKVESRQRIDYMRQGKPLIGNTPDPEQNPWFHAVNRNKKSISVNLRSERGVQLVRQLIGVSDIVIENFTPGFMSRIGLDYASLAASHPGIVMLSMSGCGQTGPDRDVPAYAPLLAGLSGLDSQVGYAGEGVLGIQQPYADTNAGFTAAFAVLAALYHRERTGEGQYIDLAEMEAAVAVLGEAVVEHSLTGSSPGPMGNDRRGFAPRGHYPGRDADTWLAISVDSDSDWEALCRTLSAPGLAADTRFKTASARWEHRRALDDALAKLTRHHPAAPLASILQTAGVAARMLTGPREMLTDPHFAARGTFATLVHPVLGQERVFSTAWRMSATPGSVKCHAPLLGEHNRAIYCQLLGLTSVEFERLVAEEVIS